MNSSAAAIILTVAAVTILLRFAPFLIFSKGCPKPIEYLSSVLPYASMALLVIYCLKDITLFEGNHALPQIITLALSGYIHLKKNNILLSILFGTVLYMILIRLL